MGCFSCFSSHKKKKVSRRHRGRNRDSLSSNSPNRDTSQHQKPETSKNRTSEATSSRTSSANNTNKDGRNDGGCNNNNKGGGNNNGRNDTNSMTAETFTFRELAAATKNFRQECLIGEGGFGRVYKGYLKRTGQLVAVKQLDRNGMQGQKEFLVEVLTLSLLHHPNLVQLIGYCADGDQRLLVYEYMPLGSLEDHLLDLKAGQSPLPWAKRMNIALDAAKGLGHLHDKADPPVIYRDLKTSNILLDNDYKAKLSDFGLAKLGPAGDKGHVSTRVMGTYGYCAPEYQKSGQLSIKSDVYSFGVVLLELITGKRAIDTTRKEDQNLVTWAAPIFKDPRRYTELADPLIQSDFPKKSFNQAVAIAAMCLHEDQHVRPIMSDVVIALSHLGGKPFANLDSPDSTPPQQSKEVSESHHKEEIPTAEQQKTLEEAMEWSIKSKEDA